MRQDGTRLHLRLWLTIAMAMTLALTADTLPGDDGWKAIGLTAQQISDCRSRTPQAVTLKGKLPQPWRLFQTQAVDALPGQTVHLELTATVKGKVKPGFYAYASGYSLVGQAEGNCPQAPAPKTFSLHLPVPDNATIIRPRLILFPGSEITITAWKLSVSGKPLAAKPEFKIQAVQLRPQAVYATGEQAAFDVTVLNHGKPHRQDWAQITILHNGVVAAKPDFNLAQNNPFRVTTTMDKPGFALLTLDLMDAHKRHRMETVQLGGAAFSPEKIRTGTPPPKDLAHYWKQEVAKLNTAVPPNFKITQTKASDTLLNYQVTCDNLGGTKTYATVVMPKNQHNLPMVLTVPGAGNTVFGYYQYPKAIRVTIAVFDRTFSSQRDYLNFNHDLWYFYRGATKRNTYYYYKAILGVMRMMDFAMTQIPQWDGKRLAAAGRSQGGGFAFIMAALNPRIQAVTADVPALCDHNARKAGRRPGWPQLLDHPSTDKNFYQHAPYFDAAHFAHLVTCPVVCSAGFLDTMCEASSIYAAFNALKGPKTMIHCVNYGHGWGHRTNEFEQAARKLINQTFQPQ